MGHQFHECQNVLSVGQAEDSAMEPLSDDRLTARARLKDWCSIGVADSDYDRFDIVVRLPMLPYQVPELGAACENY